MNTHSAIVLPALRFACIAKESPVRDGGTDRWESRADDASVTFHANIGQKDFSWIKE
jgi:hypothetical protein